MKKLPEQTQILLARMILCGFLCGALCIFMHELGHGIVTLAAGSRITRFSLIRGFVQTDGGRRGIFARQFFYAAGTLLPALSAAVYAMIYRRGGPQTYRIFSALYEIVCISALFDWIVTPVLYLFRKAPAGDDCTMFLENFPYHPLIVSALTLTAAVLLSILAFRRGILPDFASTVRTHLDKDG